MLETKATKKEQRAASDARILKSAIKNFGENGYTGATLAKIAKDASVTSGLLIQRYESKENLLIAAYKNVLDDAFSDLSVYTAFPSCMYRVIKDVKKLKADSPDNFKFLKVLFNSTDLAGSILKARRTAFESRKTYRAIVTAQEEGVIAQDEPYLLFQAFLTQVINQVDISYRFSLAYPEDDYFLRVFQFVEEEAIKRELKRSILLDIFSKEYQSVWIINVKDLTMEIFAANEDISIPGAVSVVADINSYDIARKWYVEHAVASNYRDRMLKSTDIATILEKVKGDKQYFVEYERISEGEINYNQLCYDKIANEDGEVEYIFLGFRDIDVRKEAEFDDLTGLLTRHKFLEKAEELLESHPDESIDILISDIVDFKKINETYGIKTADKILKWNGEFLLRLMNDNLLVGRYGGDQMVIFGLHDEFIKASKKITGNAYYEERSKSGLPEYVIKFGKYENIRHDRSVISSCDKAHMALNSIKYQYDKEFAYYNDEFKDKLDKKRRIEESMYSSLKNGDFKVYYQPKHDAITGKLVGAEALIRWIHPEYGFMNPGDFIPLFEANGFIVENDKYVWKRTCENLRRWNDMGIKTVPISVNASKRTMMNDDIVETMKIPVEHNGIKPNQLHVEITETLMEENVDDLISKLNDIRAVGFEIELDDFGSGYSSINILSTLPLDVIKLDMSFMQQFGDEKRAKVLAACINLAKELGFRTVSEGVEYQEQNDVLGKLGVDMIQGYLYSKPLPEEEFEKYMIKFS